MYFTFPRGSEQEGMSCQFGVMPLTLHYPVNRNTSRASHDLLCHTHHKKTPCKFPLQSHHQQHRGPDSSWDTVLLQGPCLHPTFTEPGATCLLWEEHQRCSRPQHPLWSSLTVKSPLLACYFTSLLPPGICENPPTHHITTKLWPLSNTQLFCCLPCTKLESGHQNA